jgi:hypothetical protein
MTKPLVWVALLVVIAGGAGWWFGGVTPQAKRAAKDAHPECPHHWDTSFAVRAPSKGGREEHSPALPDQVVAGTVVPTSGAPAQFGFSLPNAISDVPEYHDCQRMREVDGSTVKYGSLIAVFAGDSLGSMDSVAFTTPRAVAELFVAEPGGYDKLGIVNTFSCLVLQREKSVWRGWMVPVKREQQCDQSFDLADLKDDFELHVRSSRPPSGVAVPAVARWDWDAKANVQYVGVRCADEWCEVGRRDLSVSPAYVPAAGATGEAQKVGVKGYYDEQQLAEFPTDAPMHPGENWGTVMPAPDLTAAKDGGLGSYLGKWVHVANVYMRPDAGSYGPSLNFIGDNGRPPSARHAQISLCRGGPKKCRPALPFFYFKKSCHPSPGDGDIWYAKVTRPGGPPRYFCVVYRAHKGAEIPPVVRWRWRVDDESVWVSCPDGCCETNVDEFADN